ncbi:MAG: hypothetical protein NWF04_04920 [Candidatus Bathyarchaeota archaeon]|nr:hypothetical protein [Candidatus Bathyarchaeota archaeon]
MNAKTRLVVLSAVLCTLVFATAFGVGRLISEINASDYDAQAQKVFQEARVFFEEARNASLPDVELRVVSKQWAIDTWGKGYADPDLTNILRQEKIYKGLFLIAEDASLYQANVDWAGNFGAATWVGKIYVVQENFDPWNLPNAEATFVHELTHIWQPNLPYTTSFDMDKAHTALVEGDASLMGDYLMNSSTAQANPFDLAMIADVPAFLLTNPALQEVHADIPDTIWKLNYFPYDYGKAFVGALYDLGGWETVTRVYGNPPNTTEQILHVDKYFENESAVQVTAPTLSEDGWKQLKTDTYGEYFIQVLLQRHLSLTEAKNAAAGWDGDKLNYYEQDSNYLFTWKIQWESNCDASEFYIAFNNVLNATGAEKQNCTHWHTNGRYISITWDQTQNSTLIACSPREEAVLSSYFTP